MNLENIGSGGIGGLLGGVLALLGFHRRLNRLETKLDMVVSHETCEAIRSDTKIHISDMKDDMRYIRQRLDDVMASVQRHREDFKG